MIVNTNGVKEPCSTSSTLPAYTPTHNYAECNLCRMTQRNKLNLKLRPFLAPINSQAVTFFNVGGLTTMTIRKPGRTPWVSHGRLTTYPPTPLHPPPLASITPSSQLPVLHIPNRQRKHRLKIEFTFFHSPSRLFQITLNSYERYSSSERDRKFRRYSFTSSMKFQSRKFQVVVVQGREGDVPKSVLHRKIILIND